MSNLTQVVYNHSRDNSLLVSVLLTAPVSNYSFEIVEIMFLKMTPGKKFSCETTS